MPKFQFSHRTNMGESRKVPGTVHYIDSELDLFFGELVADENHFESMAAEEVGQLATNVFVNVVNLAIPQIVARALGKDRQPEKCSIKEIVSSDGVITNFELAEVEGVFAIRAALRFAIGFETDVDVLAPSALNAVCVYVANAISLVVLHQLQIATLSERKWDFQLHVDKIEKSGYGEYQMLAVPLMKI